MPFAKLTIWEVHDDKPREGMVPTDNIAQIVAGVTSTQGTFIHYHNARTLIRVKESPTEVAAAVEAAISAARVARLQEFREVMADVVRTEVPAAVALALEDRGLDRLDLMVHFGLNNQKAQSERQPAYASMSDEFVGPPYLQGQSPAVH